MVDSNIYGQIFNSMFLCVTFFLVVWMQDCFCICFHMFFLMPYDLIERFYGCKVRGQTVVQFKYFNQAHLNESKQGRINVNKMWANLLIAATGPISFNQASYYIRKP